MKYKIKVDVMMDGNSCYYPMVKKHWWSPWCYLPDYTAEPVSYFSPSCSYSNIRAAEGVIKRNYEDYISNHIDHTYDIPYKKEKLL